MTFFFFITPVYVLLFLNIFSRNMTAQVRQNFHQDCEAAVNRQINLELYASYVYLSMVRETAKPSERRVENC